MEFLLNMEEFYDQLHGQRVLLDQEFFGSTLHHNAGVGKLLKVIGHYEKELTIGTMTQTREALSALMQKASLSSYYEAVTQPWRGSLDTVLEKFLSLESQQQLFWETFEVRLKQTMSSMYLDELIVRNASPDEFRGRLIECIEVFAAVFPNWQDAYGFGHEFFVVNEKKSNELIDVLIKSI